MTMFDATTAADEDPSSTTGGQQQQPQQRRRQPKKRTVTLPHLSLEEEIRLGQRGFVERQRRKGGVGDAFIVVDSALAPDEIWSKLTNVARWSDMMRGVKSSTVRERKPDGSLRAHFKVTKLRLPANVVLKAEASTVLFHLDKGETNVAIDSLQGFWHCEPSPNGKDLTRVWLAASVAACAVVPNLAIDYVASKALRRATNWLTPASS